MQDRARRYSDTIEKEMAEQVGAIVARKGGDNFRTRAFGPAEGGEEWYEAIRGANRTWSVVQYRRASGLYPGKNNEFNEEKAITRSVLFRNACFFDALYACAEFEVGSAAQKDLLNPAGDDPGKAHYEAYAKAEGIVFDLRNQMPVPVANGEVLADNCTLANDALETVKLSVGNAPVQKAPKDINANEIVGGRKDILPQASSANVPALVTSKGGMLAVEKRGRARLGKMDALTQKFNIATQKEFGSLSVFTGTKDEYGMAPACAVAAKAGLGIGASAFVLGALIPPLAAPCAILTVFIGGMGALASGLTLIGSMVEEKNPVRLVTDYGWTRPGKALDKELVKIAKALDAELADPAQKEELSDMVNKLRIGMHTLSARYAFKRAAEAGFIKAPFRNMVLERRILRLQSVARESGLMSDVEIGRLVDGIQQNAQSERFESELDFAIGQQLRGLKGFIENMNARDAQQAKKALTYQGPA